MKKLYLLSLICILSFNVDSNAQTWPSSFDLSMAHFSFNNWPSSSPAGTYPEGMQFYFLATTSDPSEVDTIGEDYNAAYNLTSSTRIKGLGNDGFSFINIGSSQYSSKGYKCGAAILALNTIGRDSITVGWQAKTMNASVRTNIVRLYYRIGDSDNWNPCLDSSGNYVEYANGNTAGHTESIDFVKLPDSTANQPLIQLMWKYFQADTSQSTGARPEIAITNISVVSSGPPLPAPPAIYFNKDSLVNFYSPVNVVSRLDSFEFSAGNLTHDLQIVASPSFEIADDITGNYAQTIDINVTNDSVEPKKIFVRFNSAIPGNVIGSILVTSENIKDSLVAIGWAYQSTDPLPFELKSNNYHFSSWDVNEPAGTYPESMIFQVTHISNSPLTYAPLTYDWQCGYNLSSRPRFNGLGENGISFQNTAAPQYDNCEDGATDLNAFIGGIVLALNTLDIDSAWMEYEIQALTVGSGNNPREHAVRLQYRTSILEPFRDLEPLQEFSTKNKSANDSELFSLDLPIYLLGQANLQLRWLHYDKNIENASGSRPRFRIDNIKVEKKTKEVNIHNNFLEEKDFILFPNPVGRATTLYFSEKTSGNLYDITGRKIATLTNQNHLLLDNVNPGIYILKTEYGKSYKIAVE